MTKYRSFIFVVHENHGMLLLHCTRKIKKGDHYQIPGGHLDDVDFLVTNNYCNDRSDEFNIDESQRNLLMAGMVGVARELYEETGIDFRIIPQEQLPLGGDNSKGNSRIYPLPLYDSSDNATNNMPANKDGAPKRQLPNEFKHRLFYTVVVTDDDFMTSSDSGTPNITTSGVNHKDDTNINTSTYNPQPPSHIRLKLSHEHSGYTFVKDDVDMIDSMIALHSGGAIAKAFRMACHIKAKYPNVNDPWNIVGISSRPTTHNSSWNDEIGEGDIEVNDAADDEEDDDE